VKDFEATLSANDAWQRQRYTILRIVKPDRNDSTFVTQHNFADPGAIARVILKTPFIRDLKTEVGRPWRQSSQ
jgi:hypothetical protein